MPKSQCRNTTMKKQENRMPLKSATLLTMKRAIQLKYRQEFQNSDCEKYSSTLNMM